MSPPSRRAFSSRSAAARAARGGGRVRIIGGEWRGRRLAVADAVGLRPSGDRVRETLFNWLQPHVVGACCLDLFAGSGALGLEAASRGAAAVTLVERDARVHATLEATLAALGGAPRVRLVRGAASAFLATSDTPFDLVFVDPPFDDACQGDVLCALAHGHLAAGARVYVEAPTRQPWPPWPPPSPPASSRSTHASGVAAASPPFETERERAFGDVTARLLRLVP